MNVVAFSRDDRLLATGGWDNTVRLWDGRTGAARQTLAGHANCVFSVAVSADGKKVVTGSHDKTVVLWDAATGNILQTFAGHSAEVSSVALSAAVALCGCTNRAVPMIATPTVRLFMKFQEYVRISDASSRRTSCGKPVDDSCISCGRSDS